ncbi:PREDICTED: uncharacterized protein LOC109187500 [Ipomoea nil]|uniref:uncharacterized protein LOC109187500 n=1 Tax=Ipomoea nil TaxID=35883 RepID=UPI000900BD3F|nr:PREDICTED: uncharacterized protein LOC109187500 [Ipomoea nil]
MGWIPLRFNQEPANRSKSAVNVSHGGVVGLRILTHHLPQGDHHRPSSNLLLLSALNIRKPRAPQQPCFLKWCCLCRRALRLDKQVYMYRGDQGFCSVECRSRQILMDERKEIEIATKNRLASLRHRRDGGRRRCDASALKLDEYPHRSKTLSPCSNRRAIFTLS